MLFSDNFREPVYVRIHFVVNVRSFKVSRCRREDIAVQSACTQAFIHTFTDVSYHTRRFALCTRSRSRLSHLGVNTARSTCAACSLYESNLYAVPSVYSFLSAFSCNPIIYGHVQTVRAMSLWPICIQLTTTEL